MKVVLPLNKVTTYSDADVTSDHSFLLASLKLKLALVKNHIKLLKLDLAKIKARRNKTKVNKDLRGLRNNNLELTPIES